MSWSPTIAAIKLAAADHFGLPVQALDAPRMSRDLVRARTVAIKATSELTAKSLVQIGRGFGGRDHSTILSAMRRFDSEAKKDQQLLSDLEAITLKVSQGAGDRLRNGLHDLADLLAPMVARAVMAQMKVRLAPEQSAEPAPPVPQISRELQSAIDAVADASRKLDTAQFTNLERSARAKLEQAAAALRNLTQTRKEAIRG